MSVPHVMVMPKSNPSPDSGPRRQASTHGPEAEALLDEVRGAIGTLAQVLSHDLDLGEPLTHAIRGAVDQVSAKLDRRELRVVVVGEERSGKSTFLDALLGERLLGLAKTPPNTVTTIRSKPELGYRAQLTDGFIDDFALRVPDQTSALMSEIERAEARLSEEKKRSIAAAVEVAGAADALEQVEAALTEAFRAFEAARAGAEVCSTKLQTALQTWGRLSTDTTELASGLPAVVRRQRAWWAFWLWAIAVVAVLLNWRRWQRHRALLSAREKAETEVDALRAESSRAAGQCGQTEAELADANVPVEEARRALEVARRTEHDAKTACETLENEVNELRREVERSRSERRRRFVSEVRALCNMEDRGKDVVELEIDYPAWLLPDDIVLIETPGVTSHDVSASERAWRAIRERADTCILVSELEHAVSGETQKFLQPLREAVPHAILLLTKMDEMQGSAPLEGAGDPAEQVERARKIGTRRFARELGRDPSTVLSVTVAAEETMRGAPSSEPDRRRFEADVATLFTLLRYERALILGASSGSIVRRCIRDLSEAEEPTALAHRDRIASLEAQRIPDPEQFYREQMTSVDHAIAENAKVVVTGAVSVLRENTDLARVEYRTKIGACKTKADLRQLAAQLAEMMTRRLALARDVVRSHFDAQADRGTQDLERNVLQALRERYYILHEVKRPADLRVVVDAALVKPVAPAHLAAHFDGILRSFDRVRVGIGIGGAILGAALGTLVLPGIGTLVGALLGGLATFARTLGALRLDLSAACDESIAGLERDMVTQIAGMETAVATVVRASLAKSLEHALARFARFIDEPIEEERAAIEREREKLDELKKLTERLREQDFRLELLMKRATDASVGLCR